MIVMCRWPQSIKIAKPSVFSSTSSHRACGYNALMSRHLPFIIDAFGWFPPERVRVSTVDTPRPTTPALEVLIEKEWAHRLELARQTNGMLFNGPLLRYVDHAVKSDHSEKALVFHLTVAPTCYRDFVGTNLFNHHRLDEFGWHTFANPIGTTATLITADGLICYGVRSARVSYHASHVHTFGGSFEECDRRPDGTVDPFGSLTREILEELNVRPNELKDLACVGLVRDKEIHQPEMLFEATLDLTAAQLRRRWESAEARDEHDDLVTLPDQPGAIVPFIRSCKRIAPVAIGALFLHGRLRWGEDWFTSAARSFG